ncbi:tRNA processing endoribonuclease [Colletotrichum kahawae]|uniref:ribonuclease Z n=1 Tax=Colletotrichum kahawae TaxID=34407 RepID=A0AAD9YRB7_COLKA|nr:tRNA processing endoribonuclease [Colletotrichum kahawae]
MPGRGRANVGPTFRRRTPVSAPRPFFAKPLGEKPLEKPPSARLNDRDEASRPTPPPAAKAASAQHRAVKPKASTNTVTPKRRSADTVKSKQDSSLSGSRKRLWNLEPRPRRPSEPDNVDAFLLETFDFMRAPKELTAAIKRLSYNKKRYSLSNKGKVVYPGNPDDFGGKSAYLTPSDWNRATPGRWYLRSFLLTGPPIRKSPIPWKPNERVENMTNHVQITTTPTADTGGSLLLHFDHRRYLFGHLSEGTQRALGQRKVALAKLENMFMSGQTKWQYTGGMVGMMLTVADVLEGSRKEIESQNHARKQSQKALLETKGPERVEIHGGRNLTYSLATARYFVFRKGMPIHPVECYDDPRIANPEATTPEWEDDAIQVWKVPVVADGPFPHQIRSRKRSHEVMAAEDEQVAADQTSQPTLSPQSQERLNREGVAAVVEDMFNSDWSKDTLCETNLHNVSLPATIFVRKNGQIERYKGPLPGDKGPVPDIDVLVRFPWPATKVAHLPSPNQPSDMSVCYIVKNRGRRGKFNPQLAKQYGIKPVEFKHLAAGRTVKGADGVDVTPDMVLGERIKPCGFALVDIPSLSAVKSFLARPEWKNSSLMENVPIFYWLLGPTVIDDTRIQSFMRERPGVNHIVLAPQTSPNMVTIESCAILLTKLRRIDSDRFPLLNFDNSVRDLSFIGPNVQAGRVGMKAMLSPGFSMKNDEIHPFPTFEEVNAIPEEVLALADEAKAAIKEPKFMAEVEQVEKDIPNRDAEIIPLGTGSALPSKYRNVSSTLIRVPQYGNYILDAGENTMGQLRRAFPADKLVQILQNLRCIFISHMHADHHLGTASLLRAWCDATEHLNPRPKLVIYCPMSMQLFLQEYGRIEDIGTVKDRRIECRNVIWPNGDDQLPKDDPTRLASAVLVPVKHCQNSYAPVFSFPSGLKIAFSGDCRPSDWLVKAGKGATLLIHESTFDDDKKGDAIAKKHSTMSEALDVAYRMGARRVLLTHFSQRYAKVPIAEKRETADGSDQAVLLAFDQMRVKLGEFRQAQKFLPAIRRYFELTGAD